MMDPGYHQERRPDAHSGNPCPRRPEAPCPPAPRRSVGRPVGLLVGASSSRLPENKVDKCAERAGTGGQGPGVVRDVLNLCAECPPPIFNFNLRNVRKRPEQGQEPGWVREMFNTGEQVVCA